MLQNDSSPKPYNLRKRDKKHNQVVAEDLTKDSSQDDSSSQVTESSGSDRVNDSSESGSEKILDGQKRKQVKNISKASSKPEKSSSSESAQPVKHTSASKETCQHDTNSGLLQLGLMIIIIIFYLVIVNGQVCQLIHVWFPFNQGMINVDTNTYSRPINHRYGNLTHELEVLQKKHARLNLGDDFWDVIMGSSWSHMESERSIKQPVVLMLVAQPGSRHLNEVAQDIGKMFAKTFTQGSEDLVHIDGATQSSQDTGKAKLDIDRKLKEEFDKGGKVALVSQFDKLPGCAVMLFHSYCDSDNAPYKDVVILFTFQLMKTVPLPATPKDIEEAAQAHLDQAWSRCPEELTKDKVTAMHSRVSNNIVFVSEI